MVALRAALTGGGEELVLRRVGVVLVEAAFELVELSVAAKVLVASAEPSPQHRQAVFDRSLVT